VYSISYVIVCQWLSAGQSLFSVSSTIKTDSHDITENTITFNLKARSCL
jgi:hypothetical protein